MACFGDGGPHVSERLYRFTGDILRYETTLSILSWLPRHECLRSAGLRRTRISTLNRCVCMARALTAARRHPQDMQEHRVCVHRATAHCAQGGHAVDAGLARPVWL